MPSGGLDFPEIDVIYAQFAALTALFPEPGGHLLLYAGLDHEGIAVAMAANVAGAASLGIEADAERAKQALRAGVCDFVVNNLDEALRILKNEIRKKRSVSVVLVGDAREMVAEMVERGVQPEIVAGHTADPSCRSGSMETLVERGARRPGFGDGPGEGVSWSVEQEPIRWLPVMDRLAAKALDSADASTVARRRWIEAAPRYLGRALAGERYLRMSTAEANAFTDAVKHGGIDVVVKISRRRSSSIG